MQHRQKILFPASSVLLFVLLCGGNANLLHEKENIKDHVFCANLNEEAPANRVTYESNDISGCGINLRGSNNIIDEKKESDALVQTQRAIRKKKNKKNKKNNKKEEKNTKDKQNKNKNDENDNEIISDKNPGSKSSKKSKNPQTAKTSKSSTMVACFNEERVECGINNKIYVCRYDKYEDIYTTDCLGEDKVSLLLSRNERDYCGICKPTEKVLCFEGTRAECGNDMVYTCHYDEAQGVHTNFCVAEDDLLNHLSENQKDYYGICKETTFVENSVFRSVPDANGHETQGIYEIEYDGSFNEDGIIDLSKSFDIIDAISCSPGSVEILFTNPIPTASLSEMFPQGAILVVNGDLFGVSCNVFAAYDGDRSPTSNDGFLVVGESQGEGPLVTVSGIPAIFEMLFRDLSLKFSIDSTSDGGEGRKLVKLEDNIPPFNVVLPPDGPIQLLASVDISGRAYIKNFNYHVSAVKGDSWYEIYPQIDASVELGYDAEIKLAGGIKMTPTYDFQLFKVAFDTIKISLAEIGIPDGILNGVLSSSKLKVGLSLQMPIEVSIDMKSTFSSEVRYDSTIVLGEKRGLVHISGNPLKPWNMMPIWESIEIEEPNAAGNLSPEENGELSLLASSDAPVLSAVANFVFKPQIRLSFFDAAYVGAGNYFRLESVSVYRSYPFPPKNNGYKCEGCHSAVSKLAVVLQDFVLVYRNLISGDPDSETPLDPFAKKVELLDICLLGLVDNIPCGTSCCNPTDVCEDNVCTAEPCLLECCSNDHCISPKTCNSIGECDCPYECCEDLDCTGDAICDSVTHRCRSDEIEIGDRPFKILHLGDSYSAGTGARFYDDPMGCYRSKKNWGSRFAELMGGKGRAVTYINRACNGGVMNHYSNKRLLSKDVIPCRPPLLDEIISEDDTDCNRYVKPQKFSVSEDMDVVLLTMGGNDLNFADVVMKCFVAGSLSPAGCRETVSGANELLLQYRESMKVILNDTANGMKPGGTVILSSYPYLLTDADYIIESFDDRYDAGTAIRDLADRFDNEQRLAVQEVNEANAAKLAQVPPASGRVLYFDGTKGLFAGHEPDPGLAGFNMRSWINDLLQPAGDFNEWYHPNADGHRAWGDAVFRFFENMGASGEGSGSNHFGSNNLDLVFVIDATGSMSGVISSVKEKMEDIVDQIVESSQSYRIGIVTYKDFPSAGGSFGDYPSLVELDFSNDLAEIQSAISGIYVSGGGDWDETVLSGINTAFDMDWRPGVTKVTIVMGDAPAKIGDDGAEPISGLTPDQLIAKSAALDPVGVTALELGGLASSESPVARISIGTGGSVVSGDDGVVTAIEGILEGVSKQPFAWFGESIVGKVGEALVFDARGSFDPYGSKISTYEWDFDGDGVYDVSTGEALVSHVYTDPFDGIVVLRVTSAGGQGLASAHVVVNAQGSISQSHDDVCEMDEETGLPIVKDADGIPLLCSVNSTMWPTENREGVIVVTDHEQTRILVERCVQFLGSEVVEYEECAVQNQVWETKRKMTAGYLGLACESIDDILRLFQHEVGYSSNACSELCRGVLP